MQSRNYSTQTIVTYKKMVERFLNSGEFKEGNIEKIGSKEINQYHEDWASQGGSPASIHQSVNALRLYLSHFRKGRPCPKGHRPAQKRKGVAEGT